VAAVAIHIRIGSVYAWSAFNRPIKAMFPNDPGWFKPALHHLGGIGLAFGSKAYFIIMTIGAAIIRRPPSRGRPEAWTPPVRSNKMITDRNLTRNAAIRTPQFYMAEHIPRILRGADCSLSADPGLANVGAIHGVLLTSGAPRLSSDPLS
jgi:hypothetical protein